MRKQILSYRNGKTVPWAIVILTIFLISIFFTLTLQAAAINSEEVEEYSTYGLGWIPEDIEDIPSAVFNSNAEIYFSRSIKTNVDLADRFPIPGDQGQIGSCTSWATGYALKSFQESEERGGRSFNPSTVFSPSFLYNQTKVDGGGSSVFVAMTLIEEKGIATLATMPYRDCVTDFEPRRTPSESIMNEASYYRALSQGIEIINSRWSPPYPAKRDIEGDMHRVKEYLSNSIPVVIGIPIYSKFDSLRANNPVYNSFEGTYRGTHAMCLVGYDEETQMFKYINSWGTGWGKNGFGYITYDLIKQFQAAADNNSRPGQATTPWFYTMLDETFMATIESITIAKDSGNSRNFTASVKAKNTGTGVWSAANGIELYAVLGSGEEFSLVLPANKNVNPGENYIFSFSASTLGNSNVSVTAQMDRANMGLFGASLQTSFTFPSPSPTPTPSPTSKPSLTPVPTTPPVPVDPVEAFVTRLYKQVLLRNPDSSGLNQWIKDLKSKRIKGAVAADGFFESDEFKRRNLKNEDYVEILYTTILGRKSDNQGKTNWVNLINSGVTRRYIADQFYGSNEFIQLCKSYGIEAGRLALQDVLEKNIGATTFVHRIYSKALNRQPDLAGHKDWVGKIISKQQSPEQVAENFFGSSEFINKKLDNSAYVKVLYRTFLDREADAHGLNDWVSQLNSGKSRNSVLKGFSQSREFKGIMARYGL